MDPKVVLGAIAITILVVFLFLDELIETLDLIIYKVRNRKDGPH